VNNDNRFLGRYIKIREKGVDKLLAIGIGSEVECEVIERGFRGNTKKAKEIEVIFKLMFFSILAVFIDFMSKEEGVPAVTGADTIFYAREEENKGYSKSRIDHDAGIEIKGREEFDIIADKGTGILFLKSEDFIDKRITKCEAAGIIAQQERDIRSGESLFDRASEGEGEDDIPDSIRPNDENIICRYCF